MNSFVKRNSKKSLSILTVLFLLLFFFRLFYGYRTVPAGTTTETTNSGNPFQLALPDLSIRKNYASKKYQQFNGQTPVSVDQKYEKIADVHARTSMFDTEEKKIRQHIKSHEGLIQFENKSGNKGHRKLNLVIGIPPENFDSIYAQLVTIGTVQSKQITKTDKTNEYKELNAKKTSLEKIRNSLIELKSKGGKIDEFMQLENRILEIEQQLQDLGVSLGNFDDENEFCTVKMQLHERQVTKIGLLQRIKVALEWTIKTYLMLLLALCFMSLFAYLLLLSLEKIRTKI